jgi:hypothetical protein
LSVHRYFDRVCFGKSYTKVHEEIDSAFKYLGRGHRRLFHDPVSAIVIAGKHYPGDSNAISAALLRNVVDTACTGNPQKKRMFKFLAKMDESQRKRDRALAHAKETRSRAESTKKRTKGAASLRNRRDRGPWYIDLS